MPFGVTFIFPFVVLVFISLAWTSRLPPSCGVVSSTTSLPVTVTNSIALPEELTFKVLPAAPV